jgi:hypothetical protein
LKENNKQKGMQVTTMAPITVKRSDPVSWFTFALD